MSGHRRPLPLLALVVALALTASCTTSSDTVTSTEATTPADARAVVATAPPPSDPAVEPVEPTAPSIGPARQLVDREAGYESWLPIAMDRLSERTAHEPTVSRDVVCGDISVDDCQKLPERLPAAAIPMFDWMLEHDGQLVAPNEILRFTAVACLLLDEMSWDEQVVLLATAADRATDLSLVTYPLIATLTPLAVVFVCPEHEAATREQMEAVVCDGATPEECDQYRAVWPTV